MIHRIFIGVKYFIWFRVLASIPEGDDVQLVLVTPLTSRSLTLTRIDIRTFVTEKLISFGNESYSVTLHANSNPTQYSFAIQAKSSTG